MHDKSFITSGPVLIRTEHMGDNILVNRHKTIQKSEIPKELAIFHLIFLQSSLDLTGHKWMILIHIVLCEVAISTFLCVISESGARFTKHLKPKIFVSSMQTVWNLGKS